MIKESDDRNVSRRQFIARASGIVAVGYLVVDSSGATRSLRGPTVSNFHVTVDVTQSPPNYSLADGSDASELPVQIGDTVTWGAKTKQNHSHLAILFIDDTPFVHKNGQRIYAFHGSESDVVGKDTSIQGSPSGATGWEYYVGVWDGDGSGTVTTVTDDPTIIIGKGMESVGSAQVKAIAARRLLKKAELAHPGEDKRNLESIVGKLDTLIAKWGRLLTQKK